jgi:hypothetical protein
MLVRPFVSRVCLFLVVSLLERNSNLLKNSLTPEDGQFRPKHVVVLKDFKVTSVENTKSVLDIDKPHKRRKKKVKVKYDDEFIG